MSPRELWQLHTCQLVTVNPTFEASAQVVRGLAAFGFLHLGNVGGACRFDGDDLKRAAHTQMLKPLVGSVHRCVEALVLWQMVKVTQASTRLLLGRIVIGLRQPSAVGTRRHLAETNVTPGGDLVPVRWRARLQFGPRVHGVNPSNHRAAPLVS